MEIEESFLRLPQVKELTGLSRSTIYKKIKEGTFPRPVHIGERAVAWLASEIYAWIQAQISLARAVLLH